MREPAWFSQIHDQRSQCQWKDSTTNRYRNLYSILRNLKGKVGWKCQLDYINDEYLKSRYLWRWYSYKNDLDPYARAINFGGYFDQWPTFTFTLPSNDNLISPETSQVSIIFGRNLGRVSTSTYDRYNEEISSTDYLDFEAITSDFGRTYRRVRRARQMRFFDGCIFGAVRRDLDAYEQAKEYDR